MTNGGIIEGHTEYSACNDLSPTTYFPNVSMRVFHGAGTNDEENAGQHYTEKEARLRPQHITFGSGDCSFANASEGFKGWGAYEVAPPRS